MKVYHIYDIIDTQWTNNILKLRFQLELLLNCVAFVLNEQLFVILFANFWDEITRFCCYMILRLILSVQYWFSGLSTDSSQFKVGSFKYQWFDGNLCDLRCAFFVNKISVHCSLFIVNRYDWKYTSIQTISHYASQSLDSNYNIFK